MLIVVPDPRSQRRPSLRRGVVRAGIGPLALKRLDKPFRLAVGPWGIRPRADMSERLRRTDLGKRPRAIAPADAAHAGPTIAMNAMADASDSPEGLEINVQQIAGRRPCVPLDRYRGRARASLQPQAPQRWR